MSVLLILILCLAGNLLPGDCKVESDTFGAGTFNTNTFDHLGGYTQSPLGTQARFQQRPIANQSMVAQLFAAAQSAAHPQLQAPPHGPPPSPHPQVSPQQPGEQLPQPHPLQAPQVVTPSGAHVHENFSRTPQSQDPSAQDMARQRFRPTPQPGQGGDGQNSIQRLPLWRLDPGLARRLGFSTFMMGSVLYGLSLLPALLAVGVTQGVGPLAGECRAREARSSIAVFFFFFLFPTSCAPLRIFL